MEVAYGVRWRDELGQVDGRLTVGPQSLRLMALTGERVPLRETPFDAISALELTSTGGPRDRPILVFRLSADGRVEVESAVGNWILGDLLKGTLRGMLGESRARQRVLVSVKTKTEMRERVAELLKNGPPFAPDATSMTRHDVFVLDDQVLFLFETDDRLDGNESLADAWRWAEAWRDLVVEVRDADQIFSWTRPEIVGSVGSALGLGY